MIFSFINLISMCKNFNPEILIHGVFPLCMRTSGKKQSMVVYEMESCVQGYHVYDLKL